jgi:phospholipid/cholesterol/gamma-HCH transport system substrate-binding protein
METRAHYVLVGAITLGIVMLAMVFALWLAGSQFNAEYKTFDIIFEGPVRGLAKGGEVRFNGIKVGEITDLALDREDTTKVVARVRVDSTTPVRTSSEAQLEAMGLTGVNLIQLTAGDQKDALLKRKGGEPPPKIFAKRGAFDDLVAAGRSIADQANDALAAVQAVLTPENVKSITHTIQNLEAASTTLSAKNGALAQSTQAAASLRDAAESVRKLADAASQRMDKFDALLTDAQRATTAVADTAERTRVLATSASDAADVAAYQALPDISTAARDLRRVALSLDRLANQVETGKTNLVTGAAPRPTIKVRP